MGRTYLRVPRVQRLEYLEAFLKSYQDSEFNEERAQQSVQQAIHRLEVEKAKALGRKRPRTPRGANTLQECKRLAMHLGFIDRFKRLNPSTVRELDLDRSRSLLLERTWRAYPRFRQVVLAARDIGILELPVYDWDPFRQNGGFLYDLDFDRLNFEAIRSLATQLGLINWYPTDTAPKRQIVYPAASVATLREAICLAGRPVEQEASTQQRLHQTALDLNLLAIRDGRYEIQSRSKPETRGYMILQTDSEQVFVKDHDASTEEFEQALWKEYLTLSGMRPRFPVLYPNLRNRVCAVLRISDRVFDHHLLSLIQRPQRLDIYPSGGVLNYAANLAHLIKFLPPKTSQGNFIIYLKVDRRST